MVVPRFDWAAADFIASVLDEREAGQAAEQILVNMRAKCDGDTFTQKAAANNVRLDPSKFPGSTYNSMLEHVDAKRV